MRSKNQQIRCWVQKQKALVNETPEQRDKDYLIAMWQGYLNGLRLTNAITMQEYNSLYDEMYQFASGFEAA